VDRVILRIGVGQVGLFPVLTEGKGEERKKGNRNRKDPDNVQYTFLIYN